MNDRQIIHRIYAKLGGGERVRTDDLLRARQALSQLSYTPKIQFLVSVSSFGLKRLQLNSRLKTQTRD